MTRSFTYSTAISKYLLNNAQCYGKFYYNGFPCWELSKGGERQKKYCQCFFSADRPSVKDLQGAES